MKTLSYLKNILGIAPNRLRNSVESRCKNEITENGNSNSNENKAVSPGNNLNSTTSPSENGSDNCRENKQNSPVLLILNQAKKQVENGNTNSSDVRSSNQSSRNRLNTPEAKRNKQLENHETPRSNLRRRLSGNKMGDFEVDVDRNKPDKLKEKDSDTKHRSAPASKRYVHAKDLDYQIQKDIQMANELALLRRCQAAWSKGDDIPLILDCENKLTHLNPKTMVHNSFKNQNKFEEDKEIVMLRKQLKEAEILKASSISSEDYRILRQQLSSAFQPKLVS